LVFLEAAGEVCWDGSLHAGFWNRRRKNPELSKALSMARAHIAAAHVEAALQCLSLTQFATTATPAIPKRFASTFARSTYGATKLGQSQRTDLDEDRLTKRQCQRRNLDPSLSHQGGRRFEPG
jgi:hypothetical protein